MDDLFSSKNLPNIYMPCQHKSGWWCIEDTIKGEILDGFYFSNQLDANKQADILNDNFKSTNNND